jgi:cytidylate kinase
MNIVLEGPDNGGKSTLAQKLANEMRGGVRYHHPGGKPASMREETQCAINQIAMLGNDNLIMDRCTPISQQVYNPDPSLHLLRNKWLAEMRFKDPVFIYCRPSTDRLMRVHDLTWRDDETEEHKQKIINGQHDFISRYDEIMAKIPHVCYDFESSNAEIICTKALAALRGSQADKQWFYDLMNYRSF